MAETKEQKEKSGSAGKVIWAILFFITILVGILSLWYYSQMMTDYGINEISGIGGSIINEMSSC